MIKTRLFIWLLLALIVLTLADLLLGSTYIPPTEVLSTLIGKGASKPSWENIVLGFRLPRVITAIFVGSGLTISGLLMQVLFRNPLAGPYVLGISTGASLGVAIAVLAGITIGVSWMNSWLTVIAGTLGAGLVFLIVMIVSVRVKESMTLLIFGLMLGSAAGGIVAVLQFFSKAEDIQIYLLWTFGSLGGVTYDKLLIMIPFVLIGLVAAFLIAKSLNILLLGEDYGKSLGLDIRKVRMVIIISTCLMAGAITAFCGPIGFIGIAVPHLTRLLMPTSNHKMLIPFSILVGSIVLIACDIISQLPGTAEVLPINAVTAIFGAPIVIWLIVKKGNIRRSFGS